MNLNDIIKEIKIKESKQVGLLYHFTSLGSLASILSSDFMVRDGEYGHDDGDFISFTRDKNFLKLKRHITANRPYVRITFDGNKLSDKYKFTPHQYDSIYGRDNEDIGDEQEERLHLPNSLKLNNIHKYINNIVIYDDAFIKKYDVRDFINYLKTKSIDNFDVVLDVNSEFADGKYALKEKVVANFFRENVKLLEKAIGVSVQILKK